MAESEENTGKSFTRRRLLGAAAGTGATLALPLNVQRALA